MTPTTRKLQEIHVNLWGSHDLLLLSEKTFICLLFNKFTLKSWILLLKSKDEFFNTFKLWLLCAEKISGEKHGCFQTNDKGEFINTVLKDFHKKRSIIIDYIAPYMYKEYRMTEQYFSTLTSMKDSILIDSRLPINFLAETIDTANYLHNRLSSKRDGSTIIPEKGLTNARQNLKHVGIFKSRVSIFIPTQKR